MLLHYKAQIYCIFILAVLFFMCWLGIKQRSKENKIFNLLLFFAIANMFFDIASNYTVNHIETVPEMTNRIIHICFFLSMTTLFMLVYKYLEALIEKEIERKLKSRYLTYVPYVVLFIIVLFLPIYYMEEETGNYSYGPGPNMVYVCVAIYVMFSVAAIVKYRKNISVKNKRAIILALVCELGAAVFQLFNPTALTSSLGVTLLCLWVYMTVENPDAVLVGLLKEETARADKANQAKTDFLARVSHEIRTPINAVLGMNEIILRESKEKQIRKYARDVKSSANALLSLINEILDSSKIESGKMELVPIEYEISSILNDLFNMINVKAKDKGLELVFEVDSQIPVAYYGDDIRLKQILVNLLNNAVKYTHEGKITLTVSGKRKDENEILFFSVKDTGIGIKEEEIGKLYSKFERIEESRNRYIEGTGLGMNIVLQLLKLMESELDVRSEYGKGSEFSFELVQKIVNDEALGDFDNRILNAVEHDSYKTSFVTKDAKVLVVDDNEMNIKVFKNLIKQTKIKVYEAVSGRGALAIMEKERFDIVFLDHMMPDMDGIETFCEMKKRGIAEGTPVIMLTANAIAGAREQYLSEGFSDFLAKPIVQEKLDKLVLEYLPKDKVYQANVEENESDDKAENERPQLDEFDFEYAIGLLGSKELLMTTLEDFYGSLEILPDKLMDYMKNIEHEESLKSYRIEVHALKSSAATVGAILLSKTARLLEVAAAEGNVERVKILNPILLDEMNKHKERIRAILPEKEIKAKIEDNAMVNAYFDMLKGALKNDDYNTADFVCEEIKKYKFVDEADKLVYDLLSHVTNLETEEAIKIIDDIKVITGGTL